MAAVQPDSPAPGPYLTRLRSVGQRFAAHTHISAPPITEPKMPSARSWIVSE